jgi:hypothetical protein
MHLDRAADDTVRQLTEFHGPFYTMKDMKSMKILRSTPLSPFLSFLLFMVKK